MNSPPFTPVRPCPPLADTAVGPREVVDNVGNSPTRPPVEPVDLDIAARQLRTWLDEGLADAKAGRVIDVDTRHLDRLFEHLKEL
jgi:hypothetical protein